MGEYKETHMGKIPIDWNVTELQCVTNDKDRYSFAGGPFGSDLKSEHYTGDGIRVIQLQNIGDGEFLNSSKVYTSVEKADELLKCNIYPGDIILAKMAEPVARACKIPDIEDRFLMCSDGIRVSVDSNKFDADYITYSINADYFRNVAISRSTGTTRLRIGLGALKTIELLIPPLPEQKKISKILSTVDGHIDEVDGMIEDLKELKKGLMQKLLTEGIGHTEFKDSEVGRIPVEWEVKTVGEFIELKTGGTPSKSESEYWDDGTIPWMMSGDINKGIITQVSGLITDLGMKNSAAKLLPIGCVMIALNGQGKTKGMVALLKIETSCNQSLAAFMPNDLLVPEYLYYNLQNRYSEIRGLAGDGARNGLNLALLRGVYISVPPLAEQKHIANVISSIDDRISMFENEKMDLIEVKKGLMQQLLTGKVRVC